MLTLPSKNLLAQRKAMPQAHARNREMAFSSLGLPQNFHRITAFHLLLPVIHVLSKIIVTCSARGLD